MNWGPRFGDTSPQAPPMCSARGCFWNQHRRSSLYLTAVFTGLLKIRHFLSFFFEDLNNLSWVWYSTAELTRPFSLLFSWTSYCQFLNNQARRAVCVNGRSGRSRLPGPTACRTQGNCTRGFPRTTGLLLRADRRMKWKQSVTWFVFLFWKHQNAKDKL